MAIDEALQRHWDSLRELHGALRGRTKEAYGRVNPFYEDLFDWKERGRFWLGEDKGVTIYNSTTLVGDVSIGEKTWVGPFCSLDGSGGLTIGSYCAISLGCQLLTHDTVRWALSGGRAAYEYAPVTVGDCCFLGVHSVVVKGTSIGEHCLVGAGSVVTKDVPAYSIVAGSPARRIGEVRVAADGRVELDYGRPKG